MRVAIIQSNYFPWKGYFDIIHDADVFCFRDEVKYTKLDWRNRNKIYAREGLRWLTIPINKDAVNQKINEVRFTDNSWMKEHYNILSSTYRKAPYFRQLDSMLNDFYFIKNWDTLSEFNQYSIKEISKSLGITAQFVDSKNFDLQGDKVERLINLLVALEATEYISGPAAKDYLSGKEHLFEEKGIILTYKDYTGYPEYQQLFTPFEHGVSILDMIANIDLREIPYYIWGWRKL